MEYIEIEAFRDAYSPAEVAERTLTVGELRELLEEYDDHLPVLLSHDHGYTYGAITESRIEEEYYDDE